MGSVLSKLRPLLPDDAGHQSSAPSLGTFIGQDTNEASSFKLEGADPAL